MRLETSAKPKTPNEPGVVAAPEVGADVVPEPGDQVAHHPQLLARGDVADRTGTGPRSSSAGRPVPASAERLGTPRAAAKSSRIVIPPVPRGNDQSRAAGPGSAGREVMAGIMDRVGRVVSRAPAPPPRFGA